MVLHTCQGGRKSERQCGVRNEEECGVEYDVEIQTENSVCLTVFSQRVAIFLPSPERLLLPVDSAKKPRQDEKRLQAVNPRCNLSGNAHIGLKPIDRPQWGRAEDDQHANSVQSRHPL